MAELLGFDGLFQAPGTTEGEAPDDDELLSLDPTILAEPDLIDSTARAADTTPTQSAFDRAIADTLGLPTGVITSEDRDELSKSALQRQIELNTVDAPVTQKLLRLDPLLTSLASDDTENLALSEGVAKQLSFTGALSGGVDLLQGLGWRFVEAGAELVGAEGIEATAQRRAEQNFAGRAGGAKQRFTEIESASDFWHWMKQTVGEQLPLMAPSVAGAIAGAGAGAATFTPFGVAAGAVLGAFIPSFVLGVGETQNAIKERNANVEAPVMALGGGALIGLLDSALPGRVGSLLRRSFGMEAGEQALKTIAGRLLKEGAKGFALEGIAETVQEVIAETAAAVATDTDVGDISDQLVEAFAAGAFMGGGTMVAATGTSEVIRARRVKNTLEAYNDLASKSKLKQLAPDKHAEVMREQMKAGGVEEVYVPINALLHFAGQQEGGIAQALSDLGVSETLADVMQTAPDAKVAIPAENFSSAVLGSKGFNVLSQHLSLTAEEKSYFETANELVSDEEAVTEITEELEKYQAAEDLKARVAETAAKMKDDAANTLQNAPQDEVMVLLDVIQRVNDRKASVADQIKAGLIDKLEEDIAGIDREIDHVSRELEKAEETGKATKAIQNRLDKLVASRDAADAEQSKLTFAARNTGLLDEFADDVVEGAGAVEIEPLPGLPDNSLGPDPAIHEAARNYMRKAQLPFRRAAEYVVMEGKHITRGKKIAKAYEAMEDTPNDPKVVAAYDALIEETLAQWEAIKDIGIEVEFLKPGQPNPYPTPQHAMQDLRDNKHIWVFPTDEGFGQGEDNSTHPMLAPTDEVVSGRKLVANDVFRIVHDIFGHGLEGNGFGPSGEENAWQAHVRMYSPLAAQAMTTETRGQNSWVNYGPRGEANRADPQNTVFAEQKAGLLPDWVMTSGLVEDQEVEDNSPITEPPVNARGRIEFFHHTAQSNLDALDPSFQGTNVDIRGAEEGRRSDPGYPARTYVGLGEGRPGGYVPETGLGSNRVEGSVKAEDLYDFGADPDGLYEQARARVIADREEAGLINQNNTAAQQNRFDSMYEGMIKEAGYKGYWTKSPMGLVGALFRKTTVRTRPTKRDQELGKKTILVKGKVLQNLGVKITKESVRAAREGFKAGLAVGKGLTARKTSINKQIEKNKWLDGSQKLSLTKRINRQTTDAGVTKAATEVQARAAVLVDKERKKQIKSALKKAVKAARVVKAGKKPVGKMDADTQAFVDEVDSILDLSVAHAEERLDNLHSQVEERNGHKSVIPPEDTLTSTLLAMVANSDQLHVTDAENALIDIVKAIELGKAEGLKRILERRILKNQRVEAMREQVTQGVPTDMIKTSGFFNRLRRVAQNTATTFGSMHNGWDEIIDINFNKRGVDATETIEDLRITKQVQKFKARVMKWNNQLQEMGNEIFGLSGPYKFQEKMIEDSDTSFFTREFVDLNGKQRTVEYSRSQVRKLWMEMQDPSIRDVLHAENGMAWPLELRQEMFDAITDEDKAFARAQMDMYKEMYKPVNAVYRKMYGVELPFNEFYSPIQRDLGNSDTGGINEFGSDLVFTDEIKFRRALPGQIKTRDPNTHALLKRSDIGAMHRYIHDMAWFIETVEKVHHLKSVFQHAGLRKDIAAHHGPQMNRFIDSFLEDFGTGYAARGVVAEKAFGTFNRLFSGSVLALKGTIGTKQLVSWFAMADGVPAKDFLAAHVDFFKSPTAAKKITKFLYENSAALQERGSSLDFELAKIGALEQPLFQWKKEAQWENFKFAIIRMGDRFPIYAGGWAVYQHALKSGKSHDQAIAAFEDAMVSTQQSTDIDKLSAVQRMGALGRTMTMFMTARMALLRGEIRAIRQVKRGKITWREFGKRMAYYHFIMPMAIQFIASGFRWEEDRQLVAGILGQLNSLVIFGDVMMLAAENLFLDDEPFRPSDEVPLSGMLTGMVDGMGDAFEADDLEELLEALGEMTSVVGAATGQPVDQITNMGKGLAKVIDGDVEEGMKLIWGFSEKVAKESSR